LYKLGAADGECQYQVGKCLDCLENSQEAVKAYKQAADNGCEDAHLPLAHAYRLGKGVNIDYVEARRLYSLCSLPEAQYNLGNCLETGSGGKKNLKQAFELYMKAALEGNTESQFAAGRCLASGKGVKKNLEEAVRLYTVASDDGYCQHAQFALGECYRLGKGVRKDLSEALRLYKQSAGQGNFEAIVKLNKMKRL
jgi:TPR repeat protein